MIEALFYKGPWHGERHMIDRVASVWNVPVLQPLQSWTYSRVDDVFPYAQPITNNVVQYELAGRTNEGVLYVSRDWLAEQ